MLETFVDVCQVNIGDLVKHKEGKTGMIIAGPNEVGAVRLLFINGSMNWVHVSELSLFPKARVKNTAK